MSRTSLHLRVSGMVQGVGFRWYVVEEARRLGLAGWVRNNRDGSVELCAEGDESALSDLKRAVERGPSGAMVSGVERLESVPSGEMALPFSITRE